MAENPLKHAALGDLRSEIDTTRRVLERVPAEHFAWKPHERSMSLGVLASHLTTLLYWQLTILQRDEFDLASAGPPPAASITGTEDLLQTYDASAAAVLEALDAAGDAELQEEWTLRRGDQVVMRRPRLAILRTMGISHMVHHRAQLGVYLRLLGVPVPAVYGASADEGTPF